ncbi:uncharacterized protein LOC116985118 [Amblyraja radiata]|uniref:uncharacterized protein LOC116985118 n=1 Tax=Amblyraja radiata TaxID=386614 RepID=UPI001402A939|nr:uncharacterized protein LOC116985118 [Amblyraja radiata]
MASTSRDRDKGRKCLSGNQKRALVKAKVAENEKHRGALKKFLVTPSLKRPCIEDEENKNYSENDDIALSPITVDKYNDDIDNKLEKDDAAVNQIEDDLNAPEDNAKAESLLMTGEKQEQTSCNGRSSMSTVVINMYDDPTSWPADINKNHWQQVFKRLVAIVQFLAERNLAFRGTKENVGNESVHNGNFLGLVGLLGKFDPVLDTHLRKIKTHEIHNHYSTKRWAVLKKHVPGLSVKPLSNTRWECRIDSVKAIRYQVGEVYDALVEISEKTDEPKVKAEAESLANQQKDYKFLVSLIFWYEVLFKVNYVSKQLQGETKDIDEGMESFEKLLSWLRIYREEGFNDVLVVANELAESVELPLEFRQFQEKKLRRRKRMFSYETKDEPLDDPKEAYRLQCFNLVLDQAIQSMECRFEQLKSHVKLFGFLNNFQSIQKAEIRKHTADLEAALTDTTIKQSTDEEVVTEKTKDVDGYLLAEELEALKTFLPSSIIKPRALFEYLVVNNRFTAFPNVFIALRIYLTMPVTVASGEISFSKLKLIKTYLRSTISQERLNNLAMISIENDIAKTIVLENILRDFANKKARNVCLQQASDFKRVRWNGGAHEIACARKEKNNVIVAMRMDCRVIESRRRASDHFQRHLVGIKHLKHFMKCVTVCFGSIKHIHNCCQKLCDCWYLTGIMPSNMYTAGSKNQHHNSDQLGPYLSYIGKTEEYQENFNK